MKNILTIIGIIIIPMQALAQKPIELLEPVGGLKEISFDDKFPLEFLNVYLRAFLPTIFGISAGLCVLMVIIGGMQIMLSGGGEAMKAGRERILYSVGGLFIIVLSALILNMLNASFFYMNP